MRTERAPYSATFCVHYTSSRMLCRAGVDIESVRDRTGHLPCAVIRQVTGAIPCSKLELPPPPPQQELGSMSRNLEAFLAGRCPKCGEAIAAEMEFNDNILAMPCRHVIRSAKERS